MRKMLEDFENWFYEIPVPAKRIIAILLIIALGVFIDSICN